jgi:putative ABC transport system permease protein
MFHFIKLAFKNVFRQKKRSVTLGVNYAIVAFILTLLLAFSEGASKNISTSLVRSSAGHITVSGQFARGGKIYSGLVRVPDIEDAVKKAYGSGATTVVRYAVRSTVYANGLSKRLSFSGIESATDTAFRDQASFVSGSWADFSADPNGTLLTKTDAEYFGLKVGDEITLAVRTRFGAFNSGILKVRGIYETANYFANGLTLAHFGFLRSLDLADDGSATALFVFFDNRSDLGKKRDILLAELARRGFEARAPKDDTEAIAAISSASTRYEEDKEGRDRAMVTLSTLDEVLGIVKKVLAAVNAVGAAIAAIMLFVTAVSIFINLRMSVNERLREIGTMRAIGVEASGVTGLFVLESVLLALLFSALGALLASVAAIAVRYGIAFPSGGNLAVFLDGGHLALAPNPFAALGVVATIALFSACFSFFPARRGGSIPPVEALTKIL